MPRLGWPLGQPIAKVDVSPPKWRDTTRHENRLRRLQTYFRIKPSCHASGVTPLNMKIGLGDSELYFRTNRISIPISKVRVNCIFLLTGPAGDITLYSHGPNGLWRKNEFSLVIERKQP
jgi:hypothetical protein